ncbi:ERCC4-type nuclease [Clostridium tagluense]|uniref:ERCC4 domain-containing protein n=1 Tax=Clostridium tagluense TaxID=360422 RepID=UPI001CF47D11|nr:ERCC4 domain-containing protein [Clostridium tagluense]MCB2310674.1 ERCC4-type nuclease [Clostridium tagluense]MCB2315596.1 ERCC4-type nuclease [Clostridium tagluense]MCB2320450.1 ERCC4-type nuclease [Clostridium tagluense]MCB2325267.1 ERCC4-type nuclease [Clostridium tagluense]MCB2330119.1 ERCC4-type nuclease [Clostridium tagluense]
MRYKFTDKEIKELLNKMVILVDSREQANSHITDWFDKSKKKYKVQKLDYGDYCCYLPIGSFEGQLRDIYFTDEIVIERKFCIDELAMNLKDNKTNINEIKQEIIELFGEKYLAKVLKTDYNRMKQELTSINKYGIEFYIFMEGNNFDEDIRKGHFRSQYDASTLYKRFKGLEREFKTIIRPISKEFMGSEIYNTLRYGVRNILVHRGFIED